MCGINLTNSQAKIEVMNAALSHRGIRSKYVKLPFSDLYLGHVRLPIQGLSPKYDHPLTIDSLTGAFVGEIFNFKDFSLHAESDLPILLEMFLREKAGAFKHFDGFWSAIIHDNSTGETHIITDYLAKKPLYIRNDSVFGISSEIKVLANMGPVSFDSLYFSAVAKWGYSPNENTPFIEIKKIPPNTHLIIKKLPYGGYSIAKKIFRPLQPNPKSFIIDELKKSIKNRLVSDKPVALLMSGGLDSTLIYYLIRQFKKNLTIFHIENEEAKYLRYVDFRSTDDLIKLDINKEDYNLDEILIFNDGPVDLGSMIPQYLMGKAIKEQGFNVCVSGDGADELFGGYKRAKEYDSQYSDIFHELVYYHLPRLDKMMMASCVELRSPFLARGVIESALAIPYEKRTNKQVLKEIAKDIVPQQIINRKKKPLRYKSMMNQRYNLIERYKQIYTPMEAI